MDPRILLQAEVDGAEIISLPYCTAFDASTLLSCDDISAPTFQQEEQQQDPLLTVGWLVLLDVCLFFYQTWLGRCSMNRGSCLNAPVCPSVGVPYISAGHDRYLPNERLVGWGVCLYVPACRYIPA